MSNVVTIRDVVKRYGKFTAVNGVSLNIKQGEFFTLLGPSGCGKTTLLRMIAGFNTIEAGDILFGDKRINDVPAHKRDIGMVFQNYAIFPHLTVEENVAYGLKAKHLPAKEIAARVSEALKLVQIQQLATRKPSELSGGQQQRVALARTLNQNPSIILADEPVAALDPVTANQVMSDFRRINREMKITILINIHHVDLALDFADRVIGIRAGEIVYDGPVREVTQEVLDCIYNGAPVPTSADDESAKEAQRIAVPKAGSGLKGAEG